MPSEHPFDQHLKQSFDGFEPDVQPDWTGFERDLNRQAPQAPAHVHAGRGTGRLAVAAAVVAGGVMMWVAKPMVEEWRASSEAEVSSILEEQAQADAFAAAWEEFTKDLNGFEQDLLNAEGEAALAAAQSPEGPGMPAANQDLSPEESLGLAVTSKNVGQDKGGLNASEDAMGSGPAESEERLLAVLPFESSVKEACEGVEVAFELSGIDRTMSFLWNFGDGAFSSDPSPSHVFTRPGTYDITLSVRPPSDGMIRTRTIQNMITVLPKPEADFAWAFPAAVEGDKVRVSLMDQTPNATSAQWVVDGESTTSNWVQLDVPGVYPINLVASNQYGCLDDARREVQVGNRHGLLAQARFSPDGDGRYDTFLPHSLLELQEPWAMVVVDADGQEVHRCSDAGQPWDGSLPDGSMASNRSLYQWTVRCVSPDGEIRLFTDRVRVER